MESIKNIIESSGYYIRSKPKKCGGIQYIATVVVSGFDFDSRINIKTELLGSGIKSRIKKNGKIEIEGFNNIKDLFKIYNIEISGKCFELFLKFIKYRCDQLISNGKARYGNLEASIYDDFKKEQSKNIKSRVKVYRKFGL